MVREYSEKKVNWVAKLNNFIGKYRRMVFCNVDNVQSQQMHNIRIGLRGKADILMGKNTMMRKVMRDRAEAENATDIDKALYEKIVAEKKLVGNLGIIFTNEDFDSIIQVIKKFRIQAPARVGSIAPLEVTIPAGNTGLEPGVTAFFQMLQINTKIVKGAIEIVTEKQVLKVGDKVDNSVAVLLARLNIKPFFYGLEIAYVFDNGQVFNADILDLGDDFFRGTMNAAIKNITALSLATGIPTEASVPHSLTEAFKNLLALSLGTNYTFPEYKGKEIVEAVKSGKSLGGPAPAAPVAAAPGKAAPAPKAAPPPEDDDDGMGGGLFD